MTVLEAKSYNEFYTKTIRTLKEKGVERESRNGKVLELFPFHAKITDPANCWHYLPGRKAALWATIAEIFWLLAGRSDVGFLSKFIPRAAEYADGEGYIWTRGYGPVIARNVWRIVELLKKNPDERRACLVMWTPWDVDLAVLDGKDIACNVMIQFYSTVERGARTLHTLAYLRSNDIVFGTQINVAEWCFLQQIIANTLEWELGSYFHTATSMHVYEEYLDRALSAEYVETEPFPIKATVDEAIRYSHLWNAIAELVLGSGGKYAEEISLLVDPNFDQALKALGLFAIYKAAEKHVPEKSEGRTLIDYWIGPMLRNFLLGHIGNLTETVPNIEKTAIGLWFESKKLYV